jgi:hypothetical protein
VGLFNDLKKDPKAGAKKTGIDVTKVAIKDGQVIAPSTEVPSTFQLNTWYRYKGTDILIDAAHRIMKWCVIKFEVIKVAKGIVAVRFEDGRFEAIINQPFEDFEAIKAPNY